MKRKGRIHRSQRGFTLIEMVVVVALIGIIAAGIAMTISQVMAVNSRTSSKMVALRQVQQAGDRVSKDVLQAEPPFGLGDDDGFPLRLTIPYWEEDPEGGPPIQLSHSVNYTLETMPSRPDLRQLVRYHSAASTGIIARYIDPAKTSFLPDEDSDGYIFTVSARVGLYIETREYEIKPRPGS